MRRQKLNLPLEFAYKIHETIRLLSFSEASVLKNTCNRTDTVNKTHVPRDQMKLFRISFSNICQHSVNCLLKLIMALHFL